MSGERVYVGIDVSKARLDIAVRPIGDGWSEANIDSGIEQVVTLLDELGSELVVLEANWRSLVGFDKSVSGSPAAGGSGQSSPGEGFAKATGRLAKTDVLDAQVLAHFAESVRPHPCPVPDAQAQELTSIWPAGARW